MLKITGRAESDVDAHAQPVYGPWTAQAGADQHDDSRGARPDRAAPDRAGAEPRGGRRGARRRRRASCRRRSGPSVYSIDGRALEAVVGDLLRARRLTIAVAESCTGGLLASRLTDVPGSSDYVDRGVVCYSNRREDRAGRRARGADSRSTARSASRSRGRWPRASASRAGTNVGVGITGIAGPGGGTPEKPVGTVAIAVVVADETRVRTFQFVGGREMVKFQAAQAALNMLRLMLRCRAAASGRSDN